MDGLARLHLESSALLGRVDATLTHHGAPAEHRIWPLLRRRGLLPGDAVANVAMWEPAALLDRARLLRRHRERCVEVDGLLRVRSGWEGTAGAVFEARLATTRNEHDAFTQNAQTLADYLEDLADWIARGRARLAHGLAAVLTSAQSVTLKVDAGVRGPILTARAHAAAEIGAELLTEVDLFWVGALELSQGWSGRLQAEMAVSVQTTAADASTTLRVDL